MIIEYIKFKKILTFHKNYDIIKLLLDIFDDLLLYAVQTVRRYVPVTQWTESKFPKLLAAGSSPAGSYKESKGPLKDLFFYFCEG